MKDNSGMLIFSMQASIVIAIAFVLVSIFLWIANFYDRTQNDKYLTRTLGSCVLQFLGGGLILEGDANYQMRYGHDVFPHFPSLTILYIVATIVFQIVMIVSYRLLRSRHR
jgi:hypothetical protein